MDSPDSDDRDLVNRFCHGVMPRMDTIEDLTTKAVDDFRCDSNSSSRMFYFVQEALNFVFRPE